MEEIENIENAESIESFEYQQVDYTSQLVNIQETLINQGELIKGTNSLLLLLLVFVFIAFVYKLIRFIF